ncbi:ABATE domain-containing protein [Actinoplanes sp. NPDC049596]|uniref:CGNR zinc finger domain-containing protein n=1 Tax=unclassified Actinoplanes TaxID=2626549 RepID=UPI00341C1F98
MGGESLPSLDLADTVMLAVDPPVDLLASEDQLATWWNLQSSRLPTAPVPSLTAVQRLRAAVRELLDAHLAGQAIEPGAVEILNAVAASASPSPRLLVADSVAQREIYWQVKRGGNAGLAALAQDAIGLLSSPENLDRVRRCANPACSMLFLASSARRQWCTANICGNRARVSRHHERHRGRR